MPESLILKGWALDVEGLDAGSWILEVEGLIV